ncbi:hypothetical protein ACFQV4_18085 [Streptomyces thermocarboxydus]
MIRPRGEVLGVLALVDPGDEADHYAEFALEHAATSLAMELSHLRHRGGGAAAAPRTGRRPAGRDGRDERLRPVRGAGTTCAAISTWSSCGGAARPPTTPSRGPWAGRPRPWACGHW